MTKASQESAGKPILLQTLDNTAICSGVSNVSGSSDHPRHCAGTFLRGALEKVGVDPNIKRIGKYKSAGDQLLRKDMSEPQREQLTAILDDLYEGFTQQTAASRGKTAQEVCPHAQQHTLSTVAVHLQAGFCTLESVGYCLSCSHRHYAMSVRCSMTFLKLASLC